VGVVRDYHLIRRSGLFDKTHYLEQIPYPHLKHRFFALIHYLWSGERRGYEPFPGFDPVEHWLAIEHLARPRESPLATYARAKLAGTVLSETTSQECESSAEPIVVAGDARAAVSRVAIVCHVYFYHLWAEIAETLTRLDIDFDLICTVTDKPAFNDILARILDVRRDALVVKVPNRGRDIFPFLWLVQSDRLCDYDAVCKIHTKKSIHRLDGDNWRRALLSPILGDPGRVRWVIERFRGDKTLGLVAADSAFLSGDSEWTGNRERARDICRRLTIDINSYPLRFPAGSMYWIGPAVVRALARLRLSADDFEAEERQLDNTTAHAFERALGVIVQALELEAHGIEELLRMR
jgi:lipopolysaccharide biosynthesis protein